LDPRRRRPVPASGLKRQEDYLPRCLIGVQGSCDEKQVFDAAADGNVQSVCVNNGRECQIVSLTPHGFHQKIAVSREHDPSQPGRTIKQVNIVKFRRSVVLSGKNINARAAQRPCYRPGHMDIHVEPDAQRGGIPPSLSRRSRRWSGESPIAVLYWAISFPCFPISASNCAW
jgi:hypothetical protein